MSRENDITLVINDQIATVTLNRPCVGNAFDDRFIEYFNDVLCAIKKDKSLRVVVIKANGKHFSTGADLNWMKRMIKFTATENENDAMQLAELLQQLSSLPIPCIAVTHGKTFGGGIGLLACCDIVIAANDASFCFSEARLGLIPATIAPHIIRKLGYSQTLRYFLTAEMMHASTAMQLGLVHTIVPSDQLPQALEKFIQHIKKCGPHALASIKDLMQRLMPIDNITLEYTAKLLAEIRNSNEAQQGLSAFLNKRIPAWSK